MQADAAAMGAHLLVIVEVIGQDTYVERTPFHKKESSSVKRLRHLLALARLISQLADVNNNFKINSAFISIYFSLSHDL